MQKKIGYAFAMLLAILAGAYVMFSYNSFTDKENKPVEIVNRNVTVTDTGIAEGIANVYDAVVVVENYKNSKLNSIGSGFVYSSEGYIMTNHHVIENASEIKVLLMNGETVPAKVIGSDEFADIAVIKIDKTYVVSIAKIGTSEETNVGDTVFTIGSPIGTEYAGTVTRGILSGKNRMVEVAVQSTSNDWIMNVMQTDAAINPGNSGGPLCNVNGEVIGINSMKIVLNEIEGIGFAIPIEDAMDYSKKIVSGEKIRRAYLGISMSDLSKAQYYLYRNGISLDKSITSGVLVLESYSSGPCYKAGIINNDVIIRIGDQDVKNVAELRYYLYKHEPGEKVKITYKRGSVEKTVDVTLEESE